MNERAHVKELMVIDETAPFDDDEWQRVRDYFDHKTRTIECDDDEWAYILDQLARRRTYGVQAGLGGVDHDLPDHEPVTIPKSLALMGTNDLAELIGVKPNTVVQWCRRGKMPAPSEVMGGRRYWVRSVALKWAEDLRTLAKG